MSSTFTIVVDSDSFKDSKPKFLTDSPIKGLLYSNFCSIIKYTTSDYGYAEIILTYTGNASYAGVSFSNAQGSTFSIGQYGIDGLFLPFYNGKHDNYDIKLTSGVAKSILIIMDSDPNKISDQIQIDFSLGVSAGNVSDTNSVQIDYVCVKTPLYQYEMDGLHVYSPYDAIYSSKLKTNLSSKTAIASWDKYTRVWADSEFSVPAFQYYYGRGNYVYKVGGPIDRSYGTKQKVDTYQTLWRNIWKKPPVVKETILGPAYYYNVSNDTIDACVNVILTGAGIISSKIDKTTLGEPSKYKYYMGYDASVKQLSNDLFFEKYSFANKKYYPITGQMHMMFKLAPGYVKSTEFDVDSGSGDVTNIGRIGMSDKLIPLIAAGVTILAAIAAVEFQATISSVLINGGQFASWVYNISFTSAASGIPPLMIIGLVILVVVIVWALFSKKREVFQEPCLQFLIEYTTTPYIELGSALSRTPNLLSINNGYFCDGAYFYTQSGGVITVKELSSTEALLSEDQNGGVVLGYMPSLAPDDPTTVTQFDKLIFLPYTSGIPIDYYSGTRYFSAAQSIVVQITDCAELVVTPGNVSYDVPYGQFMSTVSQLDADQQANDYVKQVSEIIKTLNYGTMLYGDDLGVIDSYFTHEIRVETNPTVLSCFYNNTNRQGLTVGKKLFYDPDGRFECMNGFYARDPDPDIPSETFFRKFYKLTNGYVVDIYTMLLSSSLTVTGLFDTIPVVTIHLDHTSNWYFTSFSDSDLGNKVNDILLNRCFDPNTLYAETYLVRGYYDSIGESFYLYGNNTSSYTISDAPVGLYKPLMDWLGEKSFYYNPSLTIYIDIEKICLPIDNYANALFGFYVNGRVNDIFSPLYNAVSLTVKVYTNNDNLGNTLKATYNVVTDPNKSTYVSYNGLIDQSDIVSLIQIDSIDSANPEGKITYIIGTFINCTSPALTYVTTNIIIYINSTTISTGGSIFNSKNIIEEYGVVISSSPNPTIYNTYEIQGYNHNGDFNWNSTLAYTFSPSTYYLRAVAKVNGVYYYGDEKIVNTVNNKPIINTLNSPIYDSGFTATVTGEVISTGSSPITSSGVCWSYTSNPTISDNINYTNYQSYPYFVSNLTGWTVNNVIYARAFAINGGGVGYGDVIHFMPNNYQIGSLAYGGIIAYIEYTTDPFVPHGLIARQFDLAGHYIWGCGFRTYASESSYGYGKYNTEQIMKRCDHTNTAAKVCYDLTDGGYTDWFLPSPNELLILFQNLKDNNLGNMTNAAYWSSKEWHNVVYNWNIAYYRNSSSFQDTNSKANSFKVKPCRYFNPS
jgi:hypothetical protein